MSPLIVIWGTVFLLLFMMALIIYYLDLSLDGDLHSASNKKEFLIMLIPFGLWVLNFIKIWKELGKNND